jgi:hypothetical protein
VTFSDGSRFHFKEFLRLAEPVVRLKYAYHCVSATGSLLFRYDNALDPAAKHLATYLDHKHLPDGMVSAESPRLDQALQEAAHAVKRR